MWHVVVLAPGTAPTDAVVDALEDAGQTVQGIDAHAASGERCAWARIRCGGHPVDLAGLRADLHALGDAEGCDVAVLAREPRPPRLAVVDLDGTLVQCEGIDELARAAGCYDEVAAVTARAMRGELDFAESFTQRIACLRGLDAGAFDEIAARLPLTRGLAVLARDLRAVGCRLVIASGGFVPFAEVVAERCGFHAVHANRLAVRDLLRRGEHLGSIADAAAKERVLREEAAAHGIDREETLALGDGANDLPLLAAAGLGVAFHAKPVVRERCGVGLQRVWLDGVLPLCGL